MAAVAQVELEIASGGGVGEMYDTPYGLAKLVARRADGVAELSLPYGTLYAESALFPGGHVAQGKGDQRFYSVAGHGEESKAAAAAGGGGAIKMLDGGLALAAAGRQRKRAASTPGKEILIGGVKCRTVNDEAFSRVRAHFGIPNDFADTAAKFDFRKLAPAGGKGGDPMARTVDKAFFIKECNKGDNETLIAIAKELADHITKPGKNSLLAPLIAHFIVKAEDNPVLDRDQHYVAMCNCLTSPGPYTKVGVVVSVFVCLLVCLFVGFFLSFFLCFPSCSASLALSHLSPLPPPSPPARPSCTTSRAAPTTSYSRTAARTFQRSTSGCGTSTSGSVSAARTARNTWMGSWRLCTTRGCLGEGTEGERWGGGEKEKREKREKRNAAPPSP